jgi:5'-3' exonuclease
MGKKEYLKLLEEVSLEHEKETSFSKNDRILLVDGLNLFLRNFAVLNFVNQNNAHIGGLGGFLRSLGSLINHTKPTSVYVVFDGVGSSTNRKNLLPEYKSGRNINKITNWDIFEDKSTEVDAQVDQISRLINYLQCLPVKTLSISKVEADDIIAFLATHLSTQYNSQVFIASNDKDFFQLIDDNITVYKTGEKVFYNKQLIREKFGVLAENFILYKTLVGDTSDKIPGVKDLGPKTLIEKFPEVGQTVLSLDDIFNICETKLKDNKMYARVLHDFENVKNFYRLMDLKNPLIDDNEKEFIIETVDSPIPELKTKEFLHLANQDDLAIIIKGVELWLKDTFRILNSIKK